MGAQNVGRLIIYQAKFCTAVPNNFSFINTVFPHIQTCVSVNMYCAQREDNSEAYRSVSICHLLLPRV